jgi:hypothetical protein
MWFIPGCAKDPGKEAKDVVGIFCDLHATQIGTSMTGLKKSAIQKNVGSTVLQRAVGESTELELPSNLNANTTQCRSLHLHSTDTLTGVGFISMSAIPRKRKRRRCISEEKEEKDGDADQNDIDDGLVSRQDSLDCTDNQSDGKWDDGMWMNDEANGIVQGDELESDPSKSEDPWAYLWKPGAPPFKMELIACTERRNVEGFVKSLRSKAEE